VWHPLLLMEIGSFPDCSPSQPSTVQSALFSALQCIVTAPGERTSKEERLGSIMEPSRFL
jgi:hypothetical protein